MNDKYFELVKNAKKVAENAYAPYSKFYVGAAVLYESDKIYCGCNVENSSYGLALCAERNAISNAIANGEKSSPVAIAIVSKNRKLCYPCGACRQWLAEFCNNGHSIDIILEDIDDSLKIFKISELLPHGFDLL